MKIMVGCKGTGINKNLAAITVKHIKAFNGELIVVTSMVGGDKIKASEFTKAEENLEQIKSQFESLGVTSETHLLVRGLEPGEDLVKFAKEKGVDEIIIGVRSRSNVGKLIFGSTAQFVILEAHCPVLSLK